MVREKHSLSIERDLWDLAKSNNANISKLLEEAIDFRFGQSSNKFMKGISNCFRCKKKISLSDVSVIMAGPWIQGDHFGTDGPDENMLFFIAHCKDCKPVYDEIQEKCKESCGYELSNQQLSDLINLVRESDGIDEEMVSLTQVGLVVSVNKRKFLAKLKGMSLKELDNYLEDNKEEFKGKIDNLN